MVYWIAESVHHASKKFRADADSLRLKGWDKQIARADSLHASQGHQQHALTAKSHDFNRHTGIVPSPLDETKVADLHRRAGGFNRQPNDVNDKPIRRDGIVRRNPREAFL
jgi:hypothetical protein